MGLTYRDKGTSGTQIAVLSGALVIAHIRKEMFTEVSGNGPLHWRWMFNLERTPGRWADGRAESLEEAKALVEEDWRAWLAAAGLSENSDGVMRDLVGKIGNI